MSSHNHVEKYKTQTTYTPIEETDHVVIRHRVELPGHFPGAELTLDNVGDSRHQRAYSLDELKGTAQGHELSDNERDKLLLELYGANHKDLSSEKLAELKSQAWDVFLPIAEKAIGKRQAQDTGYSEYRPNIPTPEDDMPQDAYVEVGDFIERMMEGARTPEGATGAAYKAISGNIVNGMYKGNAWGGGENLGRSLHNLIQAKDRLSQELGRFPTEAEIAERLEIEGKHVAANNVAFLERASDSRVKSYDEPALSILDIHSAEHMVSGFTATEPSGADSLHPPREDTVPSPEEELLDKEERVENSKIMEAIRSGKLALTKKWENDDKYNDLLLAWCEDKAERAASGSKLQSERLEVAAKKHGLTLVNARVKVSRQLLPRAEQALREAGIGVSGSSLTLRPVKNTLPK